MIDLEERDGAVRFSVRVQPHAGSNSVDGEWQGALRVRVNAPPVDDRANQACRQLLAEHLNIPVSAVRILTGQRSRTKRVEVRGVSLQRIREIVVARFAE